MKMGAHIICWAQAVLLAASGLHALRVVQLLLLCCELSVTLA
jgi:hypothetical protein